MKRLILLAFGIAAMSALAQAPSSSAKPDEGFFRPTDLVAPRVPPTAAPDPADEILKAEEIRRAEAEDLRRTEVQMDRLERENERAREQVPAPITGAFTGLTNVRDR
jgi:hypothetical protein